MQHQSKLYCGSIFVKSEDLHLTPRQTRILSIRGGWSETFIVRLLGRCAEQKHLTFTEEIMIHYKKSNVPCCFEHCFLFCVP